MKVMNSGVCQIKFLSESSDARVLIAMDAEGVTRVSYFQTRDCQLAPRGEALVAAGILTAMRNGLPLVVDGAVDCKFRSAWDGIQRQYVQWDPSLSQVAVEAAAVNSSTAVVGDRVGLFFSGGVDSFYSLMQNQDEITDLIFVHGFDIPAINIDLARESEDRIRLIGEHFGKRVIKIETDLRSELLNEVGGWGEFAHGAAMAAVGHLLGSEFRRILIAGSDSMEVAEPWGSHPDLDPMWSRSQLEFIHDHREAPRIKKISKVAESEIALRTLRVCWKNRKGLLNCGVCEKCMRTMISMHALGVLDRFDVFNAPLRIHRVLRMSIPNPAAATGQMANLHALQQSPDCRAMYLALKFVFWRCSLVLWLKNLLKIKLE